MKNKNYIIIALVFLILWILYRVGSRSNKFSMQIGNGDNETPNPIGTAGTDDPTQQEDQSGFSPEMMRATSQMQRGVNLVMGRCSDRKFVNMDISGRECAGKVINEKKILKLGDQGCEVLLLQQRLNGIESTRDILKPNGEFNCATKNKLVNVLGVPQIRLDDFQPDEQIGFNELQGGKFVMPYSYMDVDNLKNK